MDLPHKLIKFYLVYQCLISEYLVREAACFLQSLMLAGHQSVVDDVMNLFCLVIDWYGAVRL